MYDEALAARVRDILANEPDLDERKMFGGLCFTLSGNMTCGIVGDSLMLRLNAQLAAAALHEPHTRPMDFTGRPMKGMVYVAPLGLKERALQRWLDVAIGYVRTLPAKPVRP
ncbi:MAG TPA: TfoX/Sxy family protein [Mycobacteriales bacterium]|nr:TfoX/Sxy family protein [Mycobacteriales bacterium]